MRFELLGSIPQINTFALDAQIHGIVRLRNCYGKGRWRKRKGPKVRFSDNSVHLAEIHWYQA